MATNKKTIETEKELNINDILNLIDKENIKLETDIFVPSLNKTVHVKPLNANHSKNILKSAIDGPFSSNQFNMVFYAILNEIWDRSIPLTDVNLYDKQLILLQLRANNISKELELELKAEDGSIIKHKVGLAEHVAKFDIEQAFNNIVIEESGFSVSLNYPSIYEEFQFESNLYKTRLANINEEDKKALKSLFAPIFTNNVAQYIKSFRIGEKEFDLTSRKVDERLAVVEKLPAIIQDKTMNKIEEFFNKELNKMTFIEVILGEDKKVYKGQIDLGAGLFIGNN